MNFANGDLRESFGGKEREGHLLMRAIFFSSSQTFWSRVMRLRGFSAQSFRLKRQRNYARANKMIRVIRQPGGAWERLENGQKGRQLWRNVRGVRTLTAQPALGSPALTRAYRSRLCWDQGPQYCTVRDISCIKLVTSKLSVLDRDSTVQYSTVL